jgi:hypothetical protein
MTKTLRIALSLVALATLIGCGQAEDICSPIPDGYYQASPTVPGYTFQDGLPVAFQGWSCQPSADTCTTYQCFAPTGQHETLTVALVSAGVVELTIDGVTQTLYLAGSK